MARSKLDWTQVDIAASSAPIQKAYEAYTKAVDGLEHAVTASLEKSKAIPKGQTVKIGLMFRNLSYAFVPETGSANSTKQAL